MKKIVTSNLILIMALMVIAGVFLFSETVCAEDAGLSGKPVQLRYGNEVLVEIEGGMGNLVYAIETLNRFIRLMDGRVYEGNNFFWVEIYDTLNEYILDEHRLELPHEGEGNSIEDLTKVLFSGDERKMVISEISDVLSAEMPGYAYTYIIDLEDGSLKAVTSGERTWEYTWIDSAGKHLILVNDGNNYYSRFGGAVSSYIRVYLLEDGKEIDSELVSDEINGDDRAKNGFVTAEYDEIENIMTVTRERPHWLNYENEQTPGLVRFIREVLERRAIANLEKVMGWVRIILNIERIIKKKEEWNMYYSIDSGEINLLSDELEGFAEPAKKDIEDVVGMERDPDFGSCLRFISKEDKEDGGYDIILAYYDEKYVASYDYYGNLIKITLPDGAVIIPVKISIVLDGPDWSFRIGTNGQVDNSGEDGIPIHKVKSKSNIPIDLYIRYGGFRDCEPAEEPGKNTFTVTCNGRTIPKEGSIPIAVNIPTGKEQVIDIPLVYHAPAGIDIDVSGMSATFEIFAQPALNATE